MRWTENGPERGQDSQAWDGQKMDNYVRELSWK
jgi:hypothetical protein